MERASPETSTYGQADHLPTRACPFRRLPINAGSELRPQTRPGPPPPSRMKPASRLDCGRTVPWLCAGPFD